MLNIVLFGAPGAGKGTQACKLLGKYGLVHLSTGDILRGEIAAKTQLGEEAMTYMDKGELAPDSVVIGMIENKIDADTSAKGFIFDGFPRTKPQAVALDEMLKKKGTSISVMLALEVDKQESVRRLLERGKDSGRTDDQDESIIETRIKVYNKDTAPVKDFYTAQGKFRGIVGMGSINNIFLRLCEAIEGI